jgi:nucleotide-binding universal stress UspA family protein
MKILLAIDDSKFSEAATQAVIAQYQRQGTEIKVLHVVDLTLPIPTSSAAGFRRESLKHGAELVQRTEQLLVKAGYKVLTAVEEGDPRSKILDDAAHWNADLVILGSHGRTGVNRFLMGSVSEAVAHHASCSVQIVRIPAEPRHRSVRSNEIRKDVDIYRGRARQQTLTEPKRRKRVCNICGKPSGNSICPTCADKIRAEALARKKREDKGEE